MSNYLLQPTFVLILLSLFVEQGHGRWKPSRDKLYKDIDYYKQMTKSIKQEFGEYHVKDSGDLFDNSYLENNKNIDNEIYYGPSENNHSSSPSSGNATQFNENFDAKYSEETQTNKGNVLSFDKKWPKFEDILLEIGKKYDWKNDRWIKIKHKDKPYNKLENDVNHQKHNFIYRIVKLNRVKSKRNVVIALTAVR